MLVEKNALYRCLDKLVEPWGTTDIRVAVDNTGTVSVQTGTLDFQSAVTGTGTDTISGTSTLEWPPNARRSRDRYRARNGDFVRDPFAEPW